MVLMTNFMSRNIAETRRLFSPDRHFIYSYSWFGTFTMLYTYLKKRIVFNTRNRICACDQVAYYIDQ